jgi:predicted acyl esterase
MVTILIEKNIMVLMRNGVQLTANIYHLDGVGPQPVILARTPYDKDLSAIQGDCHERSIPTLQQS